jgi:hypothetical protein
MLGGVAAQARQTWGLLPESHATYGSLQSSNQIKSDPTPACTRVGLEIQKL